MDGERPEPVALQRLPTGVTGLDVVLRGGFVTGDLNLVAGSPGTGKTTLGNQLAFAHAAGGGNVVIATLLAETHDRMIARLRGFEFFDQSLIGERVHYVSLLGSLESGGLDGLSAEMRRLVRSYRATLLVVDGTAVAQDLATSSFEFRRFTQQLQVQSALAGCTTVLLSNRSGADVDPIATHVDGLLVMRRERLDHRALRTLEVTKLRGSEHLLGSHDFSIGSKGIVVAPRIEAALADKAPPSPVSGERVGFGISELDAMLSGGFLPGSSTMLLGTPGVGKTTFGVHFAADGARRGEPVLFAGFRETESSLRAAAAGLGIDLEPHLKSGSLRVLWKAPLEVSPDWWAWEVFRAVDDLRPRRLVVDAFSDIAQYLQDPGRRYGFVVALANALRSQGVTTLLMLELEALASPSLTLPLPAASAAVDNGILLRTVELRSRLHRLVSILKTRQSSFDPAIREFTIDQDGVAVGEVFTGAAALLSGFATPVADRFSGLLGEGGGL
jgi:circadian clock protein KaiC